MCLAIPGRIVELASGGHLATVEVSKVRRTINIDLLDGGTPSPGEWVLIHVGFAMSRISAEHAEEQLRLIAALGEDAQALEEIRGYGFARDTGGEPGEGTHEVRRPVPRPAADSSGERTDPASGRPGAALPDHGGLRRAHARDLPLRAG